MQNEMEKTQSIFYEIIAPNGKKSYLLAAIHVNVNVLTQFPEIRQALEESQACIFEADVQSINQEDVNARIREWNLTHQGYEMDASYKLYCQSAKSYLLQTLQREVGFQAFFINLDEILLQKTTPIGIAQSMITETIEPSKRTVSLDAQLIERAKIKNKPLFYLESIEEQYKLFLGLNLSYEEHLEYYHFVSDSIRNDSDFVGFDSLTRFYQAQDMKGLKNWHLARLENTPESFKKYSQALINSRDLTLAERMIPYLEKGDAFIGVGALHMMGIIENLESQNYRITPISLRNKTEKLHELESIRLTELSSQNETVDFNFNKNHPIPPHRRVKQGHSIYDLHHKSDEEFIIIIAATPNNTTWLKIGFSNGLCDRSVTVLKKAFSEIPKSVNSLILSSNVLCWHKELSGVLANIPPHVNFIDLNSNELFARKAEDLAQDFKSLPPYVTAISLSKNRLHKISAENLLHLKASLPHIRFLYLSLSEVLEMMPQQRQALTEIFPNVKEVFFLDENKKVYELHYRNPLGDDCFVGAAEFCESIGLKVDRVPSLFNQCGFFIRKHAIESTSLPKDLEYFVNSYKS